MMDELLQTILIKMMRINTVDNSDMEIGILQGMVNAYNMVSGKYVFYTIEKGIVFTIETNTTVYIWNKDNLSFDYRVKGDAN